ncbi:hypothetical protein [Macrococcoides caseolyticum]|uniref:hypothetical protein n=1 Tax=Macrococcoides caseolyticum TaxID=69966 RepID=UPI0024BD4BD1|nr:hypothetical protein [Macrococcus caseolyticus]MDJ1089833.1 hypothetical protein [Macrococcus caseolyticus]
MKVYYSENISLFLYLIKKVFNKLLAILFILLIPSILMVFLKLILKIDFSISFGYIFGVYSVIVTIILFDYIVINKEKEAKFWNKKNEIVKLHKTLLDVKELMVSDKEVPLKFWKDKLSILNTYYSILNSNEKLYLSDKKDILENIISDLKQIDYGINKEDPVNFEDVDIRLSSKCNEELEKFISYIDMKIEEKF